MWERRLAEDSFADLASRILGQHIPSPAPAPAPAVAPVPTSTPLTLLEALREGICITRTTYQDSRSSELQAYLDGEAIDVSNWRDLHTGIAEAFILLNREELLQQGVELYQNWQQKTKRSGETYPLSAYRQLQNGLYLYLHLGVDGHCQRIIRLLRLLEAPAGILEAVFNNERYSFP